MQQHLLAPALGSVASLQGERIEQRRAGESVRRLDPGTKEAFQIAIT